MTDYIVNGSDLTSVADAIRAKGGTSNSLTFPSGFISAIGDISGGGGDSASVGAVNFRDYDGSIVQSYSASEFAALTSMPANPTHAGLTSQGWNWTLAKAKAYVAKYGRLEIGQMYITDDGKTRVYIHLEKGRTSPMLGVCPNGTVDVDWGDGTAHDTLTGTSSTSSAQWTPNHNYAAPGDYVITLTVNGSMGFYGTAQSNAYSGLLRYVSTANTVNSVYRNAIRKVEIGNNVAVIRSSAFYSCYALASVTIPDSVTSIDSHAFDSCYALASVTIPDNVTYIGNYAFGNCYSLSTVTIPDSVINIDSYAFRNCYSLSTVTIPDNVTYIGTSTFDYCNSLSTVTIPDSVTIIVSNTFDYCYSLSIVTIPDSVINIESYAFAYCYGISEWHLIGATPPTLASSNAFTGIAADCIIYVPAGSLEAYQTASNWSTYASHMREE